MPISTFGGGPARLGGPEEPPGGSLPSGFKFRKNVRYKLDAQGNKVPDIQQFAGGWLVFYDGGDYDVLSQDDVFGPEAATMTEGQKANLGLGYAQLAKAIESDRQQREYQQQQLAESKRQFDENFGFEKAKYNTDAQLRQAQFEWQKATDARDYGAANYWKARADELQRGNTILGLESRPDTLMRGLYAQQGLQAPQGIFDQLKALPGYGDQAPNTDRPGAGGTTFPNPQGSARTSPLGGGGGAVAGTPAVGTPGLGNDAFEPKPDALPDYHLGIAPERRPSVLDFGVAKGPGGSGTQGLTQEELAAQSAAALALPSYQKKAEEEKDRVAPGQEARAVGPGGMLIYGKGGVIPERVLGIGQESGQRYEFGEKGPEAVVPNDVFEKLMGEAKGGDIHYSEDDGKKKRSLKVKRYAAGGPIGYDPERKLSPLYGNLGGGPKPQPFGSTGLESFQPANLGQLAGSATLPGGVPNFPQLGHFTGGESLIPSAERLSKSSLSERGLYAGMLRDVFGQNPDDIFDLAKRLAPQVGQVNRPRYVR